MMKLRRRYRILLMTVVSLFVLWLIQYASVSIVYGIKLTHLKSQVKAEGSSLDLAELGAKYNPRPAPAKQNGAPLYEAAWALLKHLELAATPSPEWDAYQAFLRAKPGERAKTASDKHQELARFLSKCHVPMQLLHEGAQYKRVWFDVDYSPSSVLKAPHLMGLREAMRMLQLEAWVAATEGDSHRAMQAAKVSLQLRRSIESEPLLFSYLVGCGLDSYNLRILPDMLTLINPSEDDLRLVLAEVQAFDRTSFRRAMEGERAWNARFFESIREQGVASKLRSVLYPQPSPGTYDYHYPVVLESTFVRAGNVLPIDRSYSLSFMARMVGDASRLNSLSLAEVQPWINGGLQGDAASLCWRIYHPFSFHLLPPLGGALAEAKRDLARHDVAACGIAAELYRLDHGNYPASLDALAPKYLAAVPLDTFSGKPFLFTALRNGVVIQSVGAYQRKPGDSESVPAEPPIVWRVERPSAGTASP